MDKPYFLMCVSVCPLLIFSYLCIYTYHDVIHMFVCLLVYILCLFVYYVCLDTCYAVFLAELSQKQLFVCLVVYVYLPPCLCIYILCRMKYAVF